METVLVSVKKTNHLIAVDEGWPSMGVASEVAFRVMDEAFDYLDAPIKRVTAEDVPLPYASNLEKMALPSAKKIIEAVEGMK